MPPLPGKEDVLKSKTSVKKIKESYFCLGGPNGLGNLFERLQFLRGYENLMMDFMEKPKEIYELMDMLTDYMIEGTKLALLLEPDCMSYSDDWGTQKQLIINPREWRHFFKPRYKRLFDICHSAGVYTYFHSDGMVMEIIPDFMEIGLDILNPQFSCIDLEKLASLTAKKLVISSDIDRQRILPFGTPEEVREYVRRVIKIFDAKNGGFIGRGEIGGDVPLKNIEAMYEAFRE
jgi:uroporphyrinogen-III decarboxylase